MLNRVAKNIADKNLLDKGNKYIVALSGGADSVALLLSLKQLGYDVEAAHCNFHLRGEESDRDEMFCVSLCEKLSVPLHRIHFDTLEYASLHKISIEMAARELRYNYFAQLRNDIGACGVCVAHHRDDSVETVLLNLVRGTGLRGLRGIQPVHDGIIRPLLVVTRAEIEEFLRAEGQDYVTDSTNKETDFMRNKVRLELIPLLKELNPAACENIAHTAGVLCDVEKIVEESIRKQKEIVFNEGAGSIDIKKLDSQKAPKYLLYEILKNYGFSSTQVEQIYENRYGESGREFLSATSCVLVDRGQLIVSNRQEEKSTMMKIPEEGLYRIDNQESKLRIEKIDNADGVVSRDKNIATLDAENISFPLILRNVTAGDRFHPFGMRGSRLLSDYMTDRKMNIYEKRRQLVLTDANDNILWVVGERTDNRYKVTDNTQHVLRVTLL